LESVVLIDALLSFAVALTGRAALAALTGAPAAVDYQT
jgi:hypothetical protein